MSLMCVENDYDRTILYTKNIGAVLEYDDSELVGLSFADTAIARVEYDSAVGKLKYQDFTDRYEQVLAECKQNPDTQSFIEIGKNNATLRTESGKFVDVNVALFYLNGVGQDCGIFVGLLSLTPFREKQIRGLQKTLLELLKAEGQTKQDRKTLVNRLAISTGVLTSITTILAAVTPLGAQVALAWQAVSAAFSWQQNNQGKRVDNIGIFTAIDPAKQLTAMQKIESDLKAADDEISAVAYYQLNDYPSYDRLNGKQLFNSASQRGNNTITFNNFISSGKAKVALSQHRCIYARELGQTADAGAIKYFDGIVCPVATLSLQNDIWIADINYAIAIGLNRSIADTSALKGELINGVDYTGTQPIFISVGLGDNEIFNYKAGAVLRRASNNLSSVLKSSETIAIPKAENKQRMLIKIF